MFYIFITIFVIANGLTAADESCSRSLDEVCPFPYPKHYIPKNAEDLERFCDTVIKVLECGIAYEEKCHTQPDFFPNAYQFLANFQEICDPNTLLNGAVRENIECFSEKVMEQSRECYMDTPSNETLERQAEELFEEGVEALKENNENEKDRRMCLRELNAAACQAILTEKNCGTSAKDALVEVSRKFPIFRGCTDQDIQKLPTIIRLRKLENEVEEALERRRKHELNDGACQAILTEKQCGTLAKDALVEVLRKLPAVRGCTDQDIQKLPTIIRLREPENKVEEALKRRK